jgi:prephenate dehydratase
MMQFWQLPHYYSLPYNEYWVVKAEPVPTIEAIFESVESGHCQFGVVPIENSTEGMSSSILHSSKLIL